MTDADRRQALKASFKAKEQDVLLAAMRLTVSELWALLDHLNANTSGCDHTLNQTLALLATHNLNANTVLESWLQEHGGADIAAC